MFVKQVYIDVNMVKGDNLNSPNNIFRPFNSEMSSINSNEHSDWSSQLIDNTVESSKLIHLTNSHDGFYVNVPPYYTLSRNPLFLVMHVKLYYIDLYMQNMGLLHHLAI